MLGLTIHNAGVSRLADIDQAIEKAAADRCEVLLLIDDVVVTSAKRQIIEVSLKNRLPVGAIYRELAEAGALVAYGPNPEEMYRGAADYAARILLGAAPAEMPVQQPARFELIVNMKAAQSLQLKIPQLLLTTADTVIR